METLAHGIAGSAGGMLAMALLYPLDQIKTVMQVEANELEEEGEEQSEETVDVAKVSTKRLPRGFWTQALEILKKKKWQVYQGHVSTQVALGGSNFIYFFWCYNGLKTQLLKRLQQQNRQMSGNITPVQNLALSCLAGVINVYICAPLWVANMRLKSKDATKYSGVVDCLRKVTANEGFLSLWNGTLASLVLVSNPVIHYVSYERMKIALLKKRHATGPAVAALSAVDIFILIPLAKSFTTVVTYPLQVAQSLMRVHQKTTKPESTRATGLTGCLAQIYADRGVAGYFAGSSNSSAPKTENLPRRGKMVLLNCAIVEDGSVISIIIEDWKTVALLKDAIKEKNSATITCDAKDLQLFLAKKGDTWLPDDDPAVLELEEGKTHQDIQTVIDGEKMKATWTIEDVLIANNMIKRKGRAPKSRQIHVLVVVPKGAGDDVALIDPSAPRTAMHRHPERLKRWTAINEMIRQKNRDGNEKTSNQDTSRKRKNRDIDSSVPYSSLSWGDFESILPMEDFDLQAKTVPDEVVEQLHARLAQLRKLYGDIYTGKEAKRQLFIVAVIEAVCLLLGDVTILVEVDVIGKNVHVHGRFEFVLKRGKKRISIVEAKRDDIPQGIAQNVAGLEALCDIEGIERTLGIVTNYFEWIFISDDDEKIRRIDETLKVRRSVPSKESLKEILGMIYEMLSNRDLLMGIRTAS